MSQWQRGKLRLLSAPDGGVMYLQGLREGQGLTLGHTVSFSLKRLQTSGLLCGLVEARGSCVSLCFSLSKALHAACGLLISRPLVLCFGHFQVSLGFLFCLPFCVVVFSFLTPTFTVYSPNLALNSTYSCLRLPGAGIKGMSCCRAQPPPVFIVPQILQTYTHLGGTQSLCSSLQIATRKAYGQALAKLGHASDRIIALDGDTKNSTFSEIFKKEHPDRFIECYIAEQNMVGAGVAEGYSQPQLQNHRDAGGGKMGSSSSLGQPYWQCQLPAMGQLRETTGATRRPH